MAAARKRRARDDEDDDDDIPARVGRPRAPEQSAQPEPFEREEFAKRLQAILDALELPDSAETNACTASGFFGAPTVCAN